MSSYKCDWKRMAEDFKVSTAEIRSVLGLKPFESFSEARERFIEVARQESSVMNGQSSETRASIFKEVLNLANLGDLVDLLTMDNLTAWERQERASRHFEDSKASISRVSDFGEGWELLPVVDARLVTSMVGKLVELATNKEELLKISGLPSTSYPFRERRALYQKAIEYYHMPEVAE